ncbi:MAG: peptide chain release factor N(5)-glutamine methyltransferase [Candidatus Omnitrophica bacterium]|nr:peptide chain release factor N(5)-glutamine methyltransferase [Candidatus Omnitrophota bacterium]
MSRFCKENIVLLKRIEGALKKRRIRSARHEAETLVRHFGGMDRIDLFTGKKGVSPRSKRRAEAALRARVRGVPLGYVLRRADFYGRPFFVNRHVLVPRPETELLVEQALEILRSGKNAGRHLRILDAGTGSGCVAVSLTIERPDCRITALDISSQALKVAARNIRFYGLEKKIRLVQSDLFGAFGKRQKGYWDAVVSNPPYIPSRAIAGLPPEVRHEPLLALDGGRDGLGAIFSLVDRAPFFIKAGGWLLLEIGAGQAKALAGKLKESGGYRHFRFIKDLRGIERVLIAKISSE